MQKRSETVDQDVPVIIAHLSKGETFPTFHVVGNARLLVVDENAPGDRVYEVKSRAHRSILARLIPEGLPVGHSGDGSRAQAVAEVIADVVTAPIKRALPSFLRVVK